MRSIWVRASEHLSSNNPTLPTVSGSVSTNCIAPVCVTDFYIYKSHSMYSCTACTKLCQEATNRQDKTAIRLSSLGIFQSVLTAVLSHHVGHHRVISRLCEGSETVTEWKSKIITAGPTYGLTGIGARDACESKNWALSRRDWAPRFDCGRL